MLTSHVKKDNTAVFYYPDPRPEEVYVTGSFCGWKTPGFPLHRVENFFAGEVPNFPQGEYEYKFIVDGNWVNDPHNVITAFDSSGNENSVIYHRANKGFLYHFDFYSPAIDENRGYVIYLPPGYFISGERYSTIYLFHGALDWEYTWAHRGLIHLRLDNLRYSGRVGEMIVVMPRENGDLFRGDRRFEKYVLEDLLGHIDFEYRTIKHQKHRAIDGLSTGGFNSFLLGAGRPDLFCSIGAMSGSYDRRIFEVIRRNADEIIKNRLRFHVSCGQGDVSMELSRSLATLLRSEGIYVEYYENPGSHDWEFWGPAATGNLQFHWWSFNRT